MKCLTRASLSLMMRFWRLSDTSWDICSSFLLRLLDFSIITSKVFDKLRAITELEGSRLFSKVANICMILMSLVSMSPGRLLTKNYKNKAWLELISSLSRILWEILLNDSNTLGLNSNDKSMRPLRMIGLHLRSSGLTRQRMRSSRRFLNFSSWKIWIRMLDADFLTASNSSVVF